MRPRNSKRISKLPYHRPIAVWESHLGVEVENLNKIHFQHALIHQTLQIIPKSLQICINLLQKSSDSVHSSLKVFESIFKFLKGSSDPLPHSLKDFERQPFRKSSNLFQPFQTVIKSISNLLQKFLNSCQSSLEIIDFICNFLKRSLNRLQNPRISLNLFNQLPLILFKNLLFPPKLLICF